MNVMTREFFFLSVLFKLFFDNAMFSGVDCTISDDLRLMCSIAVQVNPKRMQTEDFPCISISMVASNDV